jgi:sugar phosphate isomerase/epimerase
MKLGVSSYSFQKHIKQTGATYRDICKLAKDIGFDGIEFIDLDLNVQPAQDVLALADDIKAYCAEIGLTIIAYTVGADFIGGGAEEVNKVKVKVDIAERLGAKVMRHDAAWKLEEGMTWRQAVDKIAAPIREVAEYAQGKGIRTCTENHGYVLQDAHCVETLIQTVNHPNYGWLVDMGNFLCADEPAVHALPIAAPYAFHAHAKDFLYKPSWEPNPGEGWFASRGGGHLRGTIVGHGVVPLAYCIDVLRNSGYEGWLSYEFEGMEENIPAIKAGYQVLRTLLEK